MNLVYQSLYSQDASGEKQLTTNGMIHGSGIAGIVANILSHGHQFMMSTIATGESILRGIYQSKVINIKFYNIVGKIYMTFFCII